MIFLSKGNLIFFWCKITPLVFLFPRTLTGNHRHGDSIALTKSLLIAVYEFCRTGLALSGASRQLPQRGEPFAERFDPARN